MISGVADKARVKASEASATMSKRRYAELERRYGEMLKEGLQHEKLLEGLMRTLREVMRYDPEASIYTKELGRRMMEMRRRRAEEQGKTEYEMRRGAHKDKM